jgi:protein gp37
MADKTGIEWTEATWNPVVGCTHVSAGCDHCYAAREASGRLSTNPVYAGLAVAGRFTGEVRLLPERLEQPMRWRKPRRIFVNSMSDLFHDDVPDEFIVQVFAVMHEAEQHTFQVLTKRPGRMASLLNSERFYGKLVAEVASWRQEKYANPGLRWPLLNVWLGTSVEDQKWANVRIPQLVRTPAVVRFLSCEPLLGPVDLRRWLPDPPEGDEDYRCQDHGWPDCQQSWPCRGITWVIAGGESGPEARPMHPDWPRTIRDQCVKAGVPFLFKQWGEYLPVPVEDDPKFTGGRAYNHPNGGRVTASLRELSTRPFTSGSYRPMQAGDRNGFGVMLDGDVMAVKVGKKRAGRLLDNMGWDQYPKQAVPV